MKHDLRTLAFCHAPDAEPLAQQACRHGVTLRPIIHRRVAALALQDQGPPDLPVAARLLHVLHRAAAIAPARLVPDPVPIDAVERFLAAREPCLVQILDLIEGCDEWTLRPPHPAPVPACAPARTPVRIQEPDASTGAAYLRARRSHFQLVDALADPRSAFPHAAPLFDLARATRIVQPASAGAEIAILVPRSSARAFRDRLADLRHAGCPIDASGPWPASSFSQPEAPACAPALA